MAEENQNPQASKPDSQPTNNTDWADMIEVKENNTHAPSSTGSSKVLNQEEIDSVFGFSEGSAAPRPNVEDSTGVKAILNSGMVSYERLPMLDVVFDRLIRMMATSLRNFTQDNVEVLAGMNLPMLIKLAQVRNSQSLKEAARNAQEAGKKYINLASALLNRNS